MDAKMPGDLSDALVTVLKRLTALVAQDPEIRSGLRTLVEAILAPPPGEAQPVNGEAAAPALEEAAAIAAPPPVEEAPAVSLAERLAFGRLAVGCEGSPGATIELPPQKAELPARAAVSDSDLHLVEARCRLKAEGARWAATRRRRLQEGADYWAEIVPKDQEIIQRAKNLPECFLWMCHPSGPTPADLSLWEDVAGCFEALAAALSLVRPVLDDPQGNWEVFERGLYLLAEAQSALYVAIDKIGGSRDSDQQKAFHWLRMTGTSHQVFIPRYMRSEDPADPTGWFVLNDRIGKLDGQLQDEREREKKQQARFSRVRFHLKPLMAGNGSDHDWRRIIESVAEMMDEGLPPSNRELRELLLPVIDDLPELEDVPQAFQRVLGEIDRYLVTRPPSPGAEVAQEPSAEVREAARLLKSKAAVLIGGERRPWAHQALKAALCLKELDWVETREHQSPESFESRVARPDVAVVILAIRWSSHSFGDVKQFCDKFGKPLVRLPAGYNPNQVAAQILAQCGARLGKRNAAQAS